MTDISKEHPPTPANENNDPLRRADTGLDELYRWRGLLLNRDLSGFTLEQWRRHRNALKHANKVIRLYLSYL
jgi:hypothetical protein